MKCEHERPVFGCDGCIEKASVGAGLGEGGKLFRVEVFRRLSTEFYIVAPSKRQAEEEADELVDAMTSADFGPDDDEVVVLEMGEGDEPPSDEAVWTGGPKGGWERWGGLVPA